MTKHTLNIVNIGADIGCNWTKIYFGNGRFVCQPTTVSNQPRVMAKLGLRSVEDEIVLRIGDTVYAAGAGVENSIDTRYEGYYESGHNLAAAVAQLLRVHPDLRETTVNAIFGMPIRTYYDGRGRPNVELINNRAKAWWQPVTLVSGHPGMQLPDSTVFGNLEGLAEGVGAYLDYHLDEDGSVARDPAGLRCVVDVGGHTVDLALIEDSNVIFDAGESTSYDHLGALRLYERVAVRVADAMGLRKAPALSAIERAIREDGCRMRIGAQSENIRDIVADERRALVGGLLPAIRKSLTRRLDEVDTIIFAGGGAKLLERELLESPIGQAKVVVLDEPQMANARGYYKYLMATQAAEKSASKAAEE